MLRRVRRQPTRAELIGRKHQISGEIRSLTNELRRLQARNEPTDRVQRRLDRLRNLLSSTRQDIDRAEP